MVVRAVTRPVVRAVTRPVVGGLGAIGETDPLLALFASGEQGGYYDPSDSSTIEATKPSRVNACDRSSNVISVPTIVTTPSRRVDTLDYRCFLRSLRSAWHLLRPDHRTDRHLNDCTKD